MKSLQTLRPTDFLLLALLAACFSTGRASGQDSKGRSSSWDNLKSLTRGQEIRVVMNNVKSYQGEFESVSDDEITIRRAAGEQTVARKDVLRVSRKGQSHRTRNAVIGAVVGAGVGLGGGLTADHVIWSHANCTEGPLFHCGNPPNPRWGIIGAPRVALVGTAVGEAIRTGGSHDVYRAR
jgi:hypothetical protein